MHVHTGKASLEDGAGALHSIQNCPVLYSLKLTHLIEKFLHMDRAECAAVLLQYLSEDERNSFGAVSSSSCICTYVMFKSEFDVTDDQRKGRRFRISE